MEIYIKLLGCALIPVALSLIFYLLKRKTRFGELSDWLVQVIIGVVFGGAAIFGTEFGVDIGGATANARDAAPLCAGLLFGAPAGIIAGVIGGVERWIAVAWGAGAYSRLACSLSTVLAGFYAGILRKKMFDDKRPTAVLGFATGVVMEIVHLSILFLTHLSDSEKAYEIVKICTLPMLLCNGAAVFLSICAISLMSRGIHHGEKRGKSIAQRVQRSMLLCVVLAYVATTVFVYALQTNTALSDADELMELTLSDVMADINDASDAGLLTATHRIASELEVNQKASLAGMAVRYGVSEINVVNANGIIQNSTKKEYVGFDMSSGEQAATFLVLNEGEVTEMVQDFQTITYEDADGSRSQKYAACVLGFGGFVQVGYDDALFLADYATQVMDLTHNRHVGSTGSILIADENGDIVSGTDVDGGNIADYGIFFEDEPEALTRQFTGFSGESNYWMYADAQSYTLIAVYPRAEAMAARDSAVYVNSYMEVLVFAALFALIYMLIKKLVVNNIRSVNNNLEQIIGGDLDVTVDVRSSAEFASLSDDINSTVTTLKHYIAEAAARIDKELEFARSIQISSLPATFPAFPNMPEVDIYATMNTAKEVGGDFYDFFALSEDRIGFLVADVSGKGIPAALFMMRAKTLLKNLSSEGMPVNEVFMRANNELCQGNEAGMFVTAFMCILDTSTGHITFANAGHNPPLLYRAGEGWSYLRSRPGLVLAGMEDMPYKLQTLDIHPGDRLYLYTDGVTEATDINGQLYGEDRLLAFLNAHPNETAEVTLHAIKDDIDAFAGEREQFDDITMLMLDYMGKGDALNMIEKVFPAKTEALADANAFLEEELEKVGCSMKATMQLTVALEEIFVNIAHYAYPNESDNGTVTLGVAAANDSVIVRFIDGGFPFNPLERDDPDVTLAAEDRQIGGLGIYMVKKTMDDVTYQNLFGKNILTLTKKI